MKGIVTIVSLLFLETQVLANPCSERLRAVAAGAVVALSAAADGSVIISGPLDYRSPNPWLYRHPAPRLGQTDLWRNRWPYTNMQGPSVSDAASIKKMVDAAHTRFQDHDYFLDIKVTDLGYEPGVWTADQYESLDNMPHVLKRFGGITGGWESVTVHGWHGQARRGVVTYLVVDPHGLYQHTDVDFSDPSRVVYTHYSWPLLTIPHVWEMPAHIVDTKGGLYFDQPIFSEPRFSTVTAYTIPNSGTTALLGTAAVMSLIPKRRRN